VNRTSAFGDLLSQTGFLTSAGPAEGLILRNSVAANSVLERVGAAFSTRPYGLGADAIFCSQGAPVLAFKDLTSEEPDDQTLLRIQAIAWNGAFAPIVLVATPSRVVLLNGYARPSKFLRDVSLTTFEFSDLFRDYRPLSNACGRVSVEAGLFWESEFAKKLDRRTKVDAVLLRELNALELALRELGLEPLMSQKLIGRTIFAKYLLDKGLLTTTALRKIAGAEHFKEVLASESAICRLFEWIKQTFNGDLFPPDVENEQRLLKRSHLDLLSRFFDGEELATGQKSLFVFRFDVIPIEMISSIYEQFAHSAAGAEAFSQGLHYTPSNLVDFILDQVMRTAPETVSVLDPSCGSGVFLVESFRQLVARRARLEGISRQLIRDVLHNQVFGIDVNKAALQVTAFSLYLTALELDPAIGEPLEALRFDKLIGRSLCHADFLGPDVFSRRKFNVIVGNPPWTYAGKRKEGPSVAESGWSLGATPSRSPDWRFLWRARDVSASDAWVALLMKATPFFSKAKAGKLARRELFATFKNVRLINMSQLRGEGLFPSLPRSYTASVDNKRDILDTSRKPNLAPALLLVAQVGRGTSPVFVANMPWSPTFRRHGLIQKPSFASIGIDCERAVNDASILKSFVLGNAREAETMCHLADDRKLVRLGTWLRVNNIPADQGFQIGGGDQNSAKHLIGFPKLTPETYTPLNVSSKLPRFNHGLVHRPRNPHIFRAPLLLCPEASFSKALQIGRYSAALSGRDVAFSDSIVGISFAESDLRFAKALLALLNSKVIAFQIAFGASNIGIKQPKVEKIDLDELRIPDLSAIPAALLNELAGLADALRHRGGVSQSTLSDLDKTVYRAYRIRADDATVIDDVFVRSRSLFLDSHSARRETVQSVSDRELAGYAAEFTRAMNRLLARTSYLRTTRVTVVRFGMHVLGLRFTLTRGGLRPGDQFSVSNPLLFEGRLFAELGGSSVPEFHASRRYIAFNGADVYLLKPDERRLWRRSDAQCDATELYSHEQLGAFGESEKPLMVASDARLH
jgi:N-6 DNA Methylase